MPGSWPMVGRRTELARLRELLARREPPYGAILTAPAGTGKTRLVDAAAVRDGRPVHRMLGTHSSRGIPFGAAADWVHARPDAEPATLLREATERLAGTPSQPLLLVVDDAHLLDPLSAVLVQRLVRTGRVRALLTVRSDERPPDAVSGLVKDGLVERLGLAPLTEEELHLLLRTALGTPVERHSLRRLHALAGDNLLLLRELVEGELAAGALGRTGDAWYWRGEPSVRPALVELVLARLDTVPPPVRRVCDLLALSEPLEAGVLGRVVTSDAVEQAEDRGLVTSSPAQPGADPVVRLHHPLYGEALRVALPGLRARRLRTELLTVLTALGEARTDDVAVLQRAVLRLDSDAATDPAQAVQAAAVAGSLFDFGLAERLARAALAAGAGPAARVVVAGAVVRQGRVREAIKELELLLAATVEEEARVAAGALLCCIEFWVRAETGRARGRLQALLDRAVAPELRHYLTALDACFCFFDGEPAESRSRSRSVLRAESAPANAVGWAAAAAGITDALAGRLGRASEAAARGNRAAEELQADRYVRLPLGNGEILALGLAGDLDRAEARARDYERSTQAAPGGEISAAGSYFLGQVGWWRGSLAAATDHLRDALTELADFDSAGWTEQALIVLAQVLSARGDRAGAEAALHRLEESPRGIYPAFEPLHRLATAWVLAAGGGVRTAAARAHAAAEAAHARDQAAVEVMCRHTAVRWGDPTGAARLTELAGVVEGPRASLAAAHARALAAADPLALDACTRGWQDLGAEGIAADCAAQAARLHPRADRARSAAHLATVLAERTGSRTPALLDLPGGPPLTAREREIAVLAAQGLSNAAIADRLVISARTVEGHLLRAFQKLAVHRRGELAAALRLDDAGEGRS